MTTFVFAIQLTCLSLAMAQQQFGNNLDRWWFLVTPMYNSPLSSSTPCLLPRQPVITRDDYTYTSNVGAHKVHTRAVTWHEARRTCEDEGGHLAIINSIAESNTITDLLKKSEKITDWVFIGFHDLYQEGEYVTIHSQSLARAGFTQWANGQPDNAGAAENCGSVHKNGGLNDLGCNGRYSFVCELSVY